MIKIKKPNYRRLLLWASAIIIIAGLVFFLATIGNVKVLRDIGFFLKSNLALSALAISLTLVSVGFFVYWKLASGNAWLLKKLFFLLVLVIAWILWAYRGEINLTAVQKASIKSEYRQSVDSIKTVLKIGYKDSERKWRAEIKKAESAAKEIKESRDSLLGVTKSLEQKVASLQEAKPPVVTSVLNADSLLAENQALKKEKDSLVALKITKTAGFKRKKAERQFLKVGWYRRPPRRPIPIN